MPKYHRLTHASMEIIDVKQMKKVLVLFEKPKNKITQQKLRK